jgi:membrane protease YdiL (CAAX protease family)
MSLPGKWVLPLFLLTILVGAMILGPLIYFALEAVWPIPFHRAMDRGLLISAVAALGLFGPRVPLRELWPWEHRTWMDLLLGTFIAAVSIQAMLGFNLALAGFTSAHLSAGQAWGRVLLALVAAVIAPPLEETVFRGFIQRELIAGLGVRAGLVIGALTYTLAHFLKIPVELDHEPVHLWSGATALGAAFTHFGQDLLQPQNLGKEANLLLIGLILGGIYLRSGALWVGAALHSGWIFGLLLFTGFTRPVVPPYQPGFGGDILSSLSTTMVLLLLGVWIWLFYRHPSIKPEVPGDDAPGTMPGAGPTAP